MLPVELRRRTLPKAEPDAGAGKSAGGESEQLLPVGVQARAGRKIVSDGIRLG